MDAESLKNYYASMQKLYDACQPLRDIIAEHPELEEEIVTELGKGMTQSFAGNFYAGMKP
jgi:hypothetical protein